MTWRVLHLKPRTEKRVADICERHHLPYYLPLRRSVRIYPRRKVVFELPLFANYLFAAVAGELSTGVAKMRFTKFLSSRLRTNNDTRQRSSASRTVNAPPSRP